MTIQELREKRAKAWDTARDFLDTKRTASGLLSEEASKTYDAMEQQIVAYGKEIQRLGYKAAVPRQDDFWCIHCPKEKPLDGTYKFYQRRFLREYGGELDPEI